MLRSTPSSKSSEWPSPLLPHLDGDPGNLWGLFLKGPKGTRHPPCLMSLLSPAGKVEDSGLHHHPCGPGEWAPSWKEQIHWSNRIPSDASTSCLFFVPLCLPANVSATAHMLFSTWNSLFPPTPLYLVRSSSLFKTQFRSHQVSEPFSDYSM